jgi:thiol-disulfide isomerase/thioredoxin
MVTRRTSSLFSILAALALALVLAPGPVPGAGQAQAQESMPEIDTGGESSLIDPPLPIPKETIEDALGRPIQLSSFKGSFVLLNFWATWCGPCVEEMPSLDRLQGELEKEGLKVVAASVDRDGIKAAAPFLRKLGLKNLTLYTDRRSQVFHALQAKALPTTFLIDREGLIVRRWVGAIPWDSAGSKAFLRAYLNAPGAGG